MTILNLKLYSAICHSLIIYLQADLQADFVWGRWLWLWLPTKADDSEAPTIVVWEGERNSAWTEIFVWILLQEVEDLLDLMATETNTKVLDSNTQLQSHQKPKRQ